MAEVEKIGLYPSLERGLTQEDLKYLQAEDADPNLIRERLWTDFDKILGKAHDIKK